MTSLREAVRRRFGRGQSSPDSHADYAYVIYWTKTARAWTAEHRREARLAVQALLARTDFRATLYERLYRLDEIDSSAHAGGSLIALQRVLQAMESDSIGGPDHGQ